MKRFVVDASVALKWFVPEVHTAAATRLLDSQIDLLAPDLIGPEVGNALWKKVRRRELTAREAAEVLGVFGAMGLEIYPSAALLPSALELAVVLDRSVYDGLYLALAFGLGCPLVTADQKFHAAVSRSPLAEQIRWVEDDL
jgi:predicted nucleic acid-binding protein